MLKLLVLSIFLACGFGGAANASLITYTYQGMPFGSGDPWAACPGSSFLCRDPWQGALVIEDSFYPQGLAGSSLSLMIWGADARSNPCFDPEYGPSDCSGISITTAGGTAYGAFQAGWTSSWPGFGVVSTSGFLDGFLGGTGYSGYFSWVFDAAGNIVRWQGSNYSGIEGGFDPQSFHYPDVPGFDSIVWSGYVDDPSDAPEIHTQGPGIWTRSPGTALVPLPAAAASLIGGIVLLGAAGRRRLGLRHGLAPR